MVCFLHEVGEVGHAGQFVQVRRGKVLRLQHHRDLKLPGILHGFNSLALYCLFKK